MNERKFDFFQDHSRTYLEMALRTDKQEVMEDPDGYGKRTGICGDTVEMFLKVNQGRVQKVSYHVEGCINTNACCNVVSRMVEGERVNAAWGVTPEKVIDYLETLPPSHEHCAELAVGALYLALAKYQELDRNPWKKGYRRNS